jgi:hypothetical protein
MIDIPGNAFWGSYLESNTSSLHTSLCEHNLRTSLWESEFSILSALGNANDKSLDSVFGIDSSSRIHNLLGHAAGNRSGIIDALEIKIQVVDPITGVGSGAYSSELNTIFLSNEFIYKSSISAISRVVTEEIGHAIDALINPQDSSGDEGEIFAAFVSGDKASQKLISASTEDDSGVIYLGDKAVRVEFNGVVTLHEHAAYSGRTKSFGIGNHSYVGNDFNDIATSISIPSGSNLIVELFEHANFQGRSTVVTYSQASIGADWSDPNWRVSHLNDAVSSMRIRQRQSNEIVFYQHANFQGLAHIGTRGNHRTVRFNDDYSSIDLPNGARIDVFEHSNYGGRTASYTSDISFLGALNDQVSSYQAYQASNHGEAISSIIDRLRSLNPSQINDALRLYGIARNNTWIQGFSNIMKRVMSTIPLFNGFNRVRNGDSVNGAIELAKFVKIPFTNISWWSTLTPQFKSNVVTGLRAITGEYNNGVRISDLLNSP